MMRKNLPGCRIDLLLDALGELGYRRISFDEYRKKTDSTLFSMRREQV